MFQQNEEGVMGGIIELFSSIVQCIVCFMFCLVAGYVFTLGKARSGMNFDFIFFSFLCMIVFIAL